MGGVGLFAPKLFSRAFFRHTISSIAPNSKKFRKTFLTLLASFSLFASLAVGIAPVYAATCGPCANTAMTLTFGGMPAGGSTVFLPLDSTLNTIATANNGSNNVYIQWGDGAANLVTGPLATDVASMTHTYSSAGPFTVSVTEQNTASLLSFGIGPQNAAWATTYGSTHTTWTGAQYLTSVTAWNGFTNLNGAFYGASTLTSVPTSLPTSGVTDLAFAFYGDSVFNSSSVTGWTTSSVANMASMFQNATAFNQNISSWNTVAVTNMSSMFQNATNFNDSSVAMNTSGSSWKTSTVTNMASMFQGANHFNQNINLWDTHLVTDMSGMFQGATIFNDGGSANALSTSGNVWNVGAVTTFASMFNGDSSFNVAVNNWVPSVTTTMSSMFQGATSFNQNLTSWDTHLVTNMSSMFQGATAYNNLGVALTRSSNLWNTGAVTTMVSMFAGATGFNQSINNWNTAAVTNMTSMFDGATVFNQDISAWDVRTVTNLQYIFRNSREDANLAAWIITGIASTSNGLNLWQTGSFSVINYSATLVGWAAEAVQTSVNAVVSGGTFYNQAGLIARNTLTGPGKLWTMSGDSAYGITASLSSTGGTSLGSTIIFSATVTGTNAPNVAPTATPTWTISGGQVSSCTSTAGPTTSLLVSTYTCSIAASNVGTYTANFSYPGDSNYIAISAGPQSVSPGKVGTPTLSVAVSVNSTVQPLGSSEIFTANVTGVVGATAPIGTGVWSFIGTLSPSAATCNSNTGPTSVSNVTTYTCTVIDTQAGTYTAKFTYPGDGNYNSVPAVTSSNATTVAKATPALSVSPNAASAFPNTSLVFTGTITAPANAVAPSGLPTFTVTGGTGSCTAVLVSTVGTVSTYTCTFTAVAAGSYGVTFAYAGDTNYNAPSSALSTTTAVSKNTPAVAVAPNSSTGVLGSTLTFTATVTGSNSSNPAPTGTPTWTITSGIGGPTTCTPSGPTTSTDVATYTCTVTASITGTYAANFIYNGDGNYNSVLIVTSSNTTVSKFTPTLVVSANSGSALLGQSITFTATVTGPSGGATPTNGVGFASWNINVNGVSTLASCPSPSGPTSASNVAIYTCTVTASTTGTYDATVAYPGDTNYNTSSASTNGTSDAVVGKATPTVTVVPNAGSATIGSTIVFTATVSGPTNGATPAGVGTWTITGVPSITSCSTTTPSNPKSGSPNIATYTCSVVASVIGNYGATFTLAAENNYNSVGTVSTSSTTLVNLGAPTITVTPNSTLVALGSSYTLTATVSPPSGGTMPTGAGAWAISGPSGITCSAYTGPITGASSVTYTCTVIASVAGTYGTTFTYQGDSNYSLTSANTSQLTVVNPVTVLPSVTANSSTATLASTIVFTATVSGPANAAAPTSTGTWTITTAPAGITTCTSFTGPSRASNIATYTCSVLATLAGTYSAVFNFVGDSTYNPVASTSSGISPVVSKSLPVVVVTTSTSTVNIGSQFTFTATVTGPSNGPNPSYSPATYGTWAIIGVSGALCTSTGSSAGGSTNISIFTCLVTASKTGTYTPQFTYNGDANYQVSSPTSGSVTSVNKATPTVTVAADAPTAALGSTVSFTARVTGPTGASAPTATGTWVITSVPIGVTSCTSTSGPSGASNVATYTCTLYATQAGTYSAAFTFPGDSLYNAVASTPSSSSTTVALATPLVFLSASGSPTLGGSISFSAVVIGSSNALAPSGAVSWGISGTAGATSCPGATGPSVSGIISYYFCTLQTPSVGSYNVQANFGGDSNYAAASSIVSTNTIAKQSPVITVSASANPVLDGTTTLTTSVTGATGAPIPSGAVTWSITDPRSSLVTCTNPTGPVTVGSVSTYTCQFVTSIAGNYQISSSIAGDSNYNSTTSSTIAISLQVLIPTISVTASPATPTVGQSITFTVTVTGVSGAPAPTGTVNWAISGQTSSCASTASLGGGVITARYSCTVGTTRSGSYSALPTYNGDANFAALSAASALSVTVTPATPSIVVTSSPSSPVLGGLITYTATVTGAPGALSPAGTVAWSISGQSSSCFNTAGAAAGLTATQTIFTCAVSAVRAGTYNAVATYGGDTNYTSLAATAPVPVTIQKATPLIALVGSGTGALNGNLVFTATVTGSSGAVAPTGTITWTLTGSSGVTSCTTTPTSTTVGIVTTFVCNVTAVSYGSYTVTALYLGDTNYLTATSNSVTLGISLVTPSISVAASSSPTLGSFATLTAIVTGPAGGAKPGGTMSWTVTNPVGATVTCTTTSPALSPPDPTIASAYSCTFPAATVGTYSVQANFPGDANYALVNSSTINISVGKATPSLAVTGLQSIGTSGQVITFTATITGAAGAVVPVGLPSWILTPAGTTCATISGPTTNGVIATYTCIVSANLAGTYTAAISYAGDSNYLSAGPSTAYTLNLSKLSPAVVITTSAPTVALGSTFTFTATVSGPTAGVAPSGTATWSIAGVTGITCNAYTGSTGSSNVATYTCSVLASSAGIYIPLFTFNGDSNYLATTPSSGSTTNVTNTAPSVAVSANSTTATLGSTIVFTATATGPTGATAPNTGGVWSITGVTGITSCTTTSGPSQASNVSTYTCSVLAAVTGTYTATFTFTGGGAYNPVSPVASSTSTLVSSATPAITISASGTPTLGGTLTFTSVVTGAVGAAAPGGSLGWSISGTALVNSCTSTIDAHSTGVATTFTCTIQTPSVGSYIARANYIGDSNYVGASSSLLSLSIVKQFPTILLTASAAPILDGVTTLTTTVSGVANAVLPGGAVTWTITDPNGAGSTCANPIGPSTNFGISTYTCNLTTSIAGIYHVTSTIGADNNYQSVTSSVININISVATPTIYFSATPLTPTVGQQITFAALITGNGSATPTGTINWNVSGKATSCTSISNPASGANTSLYNCIITTPSAGTYTVTATYSGDLVYSGLPPTSPLSIVVAAAIPTSSVATSPVSPVLGGTITYTATVTGVTGATAPAGSIGWGVTGVASTCSTKTGPLAGVGSNQTLFTCSISANSAGRYSVTASYSGDSNYTSLAAISAVNVDISRAPPVGGVVLTGSGTGLPGSTLVFTATVTGVSGVAPIGTPTWTIGGTGGAASCPSPSGPNITGNITTYICNITASANGTYSATLFYPGDTNYFSALSNSVTLGVSSLTPTVSISASSSPTLGGSVVLNAIVTGQTGSPAPIGVMSWTITNASGNLVACSTVAATVTLTNPQIQSAYACSFPLLTAGTYSTLANFPGDSNYQLANSPLLPLVVAKADPTLSMSASQSSNSSGQTITFTAIITGSTGSLAPTVTPTWSVSGASTSCALNSGPVVSVVSSIYTCTVSVPSSGAYSASVTYPGDTNYNSAVLGTPYSVVVSQVTPSVAVTTSSATALLGSSFTFIATVSGPPSGVPPTGTVTWSITGVSGISCSGPGTTASVANVTTYTCPVNATIAGVYVPLVSYSGDANYLATSLTSGYTTFVSKVTPTVAVIANSPSATLGGTVTFTATVTGPTGAAAPTGVGSWAIAGVTGVTTCTNTSGPAAGTGSSTYLCNVVANVAGPYSATFTFTGDSTYYPVAAVTSTSATTVNTGAPSVTISSAPSPTLGGSLTFTASVTGSTGGVAPSGATSFVISGTAIPATTCNASTGPSPSGIVSTFTCVVLTPRAGTYVVRANFNGDSNYSSATSTPLTVTLTQQTPTITLVASSNPTLGGTTTLTATVTGVAGALQPTGGVNFVITDGSSQVVSCSPTVGPNFVSTNVYTYSCNFLTASAGTYHAAATIAADTNYLTASSTLISVVLGVVTPTFVFSESPSSPTLGQVLTFTATIVGSNSLAAPTGTISWGLSGSAVSCGTNTAPTVVSHSTTYTCTIPTPTVGIYAANPNYSGDPNYSSATAPAPISLLISKATPTTVVVISPTNPVLGGSITYTATVTGAVGATAPGSTLITWTLTGPASSCFTSTGPVAGTSANQSIYTCTVNVSTAGIYTAAFTFVSDTNYSTTVATTPVSVTIAQVSPVISLSASGNGTLGSTLTFTGTVSGISGSPPPTGTVVWSVSGSAGVLSCTPAAPTIAGLVTTYLCTIVASNPGTYSVSFQYNGNTNYSAGSSNTVTLGISSLTPTVTVNSPTSPTLGLPTTITAVVVGISGHPVPSGSVSWSVANGSGAAVTCTTVAPALDTSG